MTVSQSIDEIYKSRWLKADDIPDTDLILTIKDVNVEPVGQEREAKLVLTFRESPKELVCNVTNAKVLSDRFGKDPNGWIGKKIALYSTEVTFGGKTVLAVRIRLKAPTPAAQPAPAVPEPPEPPEPPEEIW